MMRLAISVEGATERAFVTGLLAGHLRGRGIETTAVVIRRVDHRPDAVGGNVSVDRLAAHLAHLLRSFEAVSSLVDFYGFRGKEAATAAELEDRVREAVGRRVGRWAERRVVLPYVQRHEFEALLFSDVAQFAETVGATPGAREGLAAIRSRFETPEDIDDSPNTAPSKRIAALLPGYDKVSLGLLVAERTGLPKIRAECRRFDAWIRRLEALSDRPAVSPPRPGTASE